jgi:hypothetical protein
MDRKKRGDISQPERKMQKNTVSHFHSLREKEKVLPRGKKREEKKRRTPRCTFPKSLCPFPS